MEDILIPQPQPEGEPRIILQIRYARDVGYLYEAGRSFEVELSHPKTGAAVYVLIPHRQFVIDDMSKHSRGLPRQAAQAARRLLERGLERKTELANIPRNGFFRLQNDDTLWVRLYWDNQEKAFEIISADEYKIIQHKGGAVMVEVAFREEVLAEMNKGEGRPPID